MGLSTHRSIDNTGDKISKSDRRAFINKHSIKKKRERENKKHAVKVKYLEKQEKKMQKQHKLIIKENEAYNKEVLKNQVKNEVNRMKKMVKEQNLGELLDVQENFTNHSPSNNTINRNSINNNSKKSRFKNINRFQNTNKSQNSDKFQDTNNSIELRFNNPPITINDVQSKLINSFINSDIVPVLERDFDNIKLQKLGIVRFSEEYDNVLTENAKIVMDYMFDNVITIENDLETLITIENEIRIFYNTAILNTIKTHLKSIVENYINNKINALQRYSR